MEQAEHNEPRNYVRIPPAKVERPQKEIEDIALRAADLPEFQEAVKSAKTKLEAIKGVRELLRRSNFWEEIASLPEPKVSRPGIVPPASNEFYIAKNIADLLYENRDQKNQK